MANEVEVELSVQVNDAVKSIKRIENSVNSFTKRSEEGFGRTSRALDTFKGALGALGVARVFDAAANSARAFFNTFVSGGIQAASAQEDAVNRLNSQLKITGELTPEVSREFQRFASELQSVTKFGDEVILNQLALAKAFGATNQQAKDIVAAATDLSASLGIDLQAATRNVARTLGGFAGELGEIIPELKNLTAEQLKAGDAIDLLANKFRGAAGEQIKTFSGAIAQTSNTFGDLTEKIGETITQNPVVIAGINTLNQVFLTLQKVVEANNGSLQALSTGFVNLVVSAVRPAGEALILLNNVIQDTKNIFDFLVAALFEAGASVVNFGINVAKVKLSLEEFLGVATDGTQGIIRSLQAQSKAFEQAALASEISVAKRIKSQEEFAEKIREIAELTEVEFQKQVEQAEKLTIVEQEQSSKRVKIKQDEIETLRAINEAQKQLQQEQKDIAKAEQDVETEDRLQRISDILGREEAIRLQAEIIKLEREKKFLDASRKLKEAEEKADKERFFRIQKFEDLSQKERVQNLRGTFQTISTLQSSNNKTLFNIGKAAAVSTATIDGIQAVQKALASAPPPFNFVLAGLVGAATAANVARIASQQPPQFQDGGIVPGTSFTGDRVPALVNSGELILNTAQQDALAGRLQSQDESITALTNAIQSQPIVVEVNGFELGRAIRSIQRDGFAI